MWQISRGNYTLIWTYVKAVDYYIDARSCMHRVLLGTPNRLIGKTNKTFPANTSCTYSISTQTESGGVDVCWPALSGSSAYVYEKWEMLSSSIFLQLCCTVFYLVECLNVQQSITFHGKQPDMFQLLIMAKQYRDDDSRLISPSELIADIQLSGGNGRRFEWHLKPPLTDRDVESRTQHKTGDDHKNSERVPPISRPWVLHKV